MTDNYYALIMAGGGGTRLWPLSRRGRPKQIIRLIEERSLFRIAVDRLLPSFDPGRILVATVPDQRPGLADQAPELPTKSFVDEPGPRGTASIIGLTAVLLHERDPDSVMACLTADHYIRDEAKFRTLLAAAYQLAQKDLLVTIGVEPASASTGYGYLKMEAEFELMDGLRIHRVAQFREKPDQATANGYLASGEYLWNSGMFIWRTARVLQEFERQMPDLHSALVEISQALAADPHSTEWHARWHSLEPETIDYGIMERADQVVTLVAEELGWWDVGTWNRVFELLPVDRDGNVVRAGESLQVDTHGSLIFQEYGPNEHRLLVTLGVEDLIIVDTGKALLITNRESAQRIREVVQRLRDDGLDQYL